MCRLNPLGHPDLAYCSAAGQLPFSITISNINKAFCNFLLSHDLAKCKEQKFQPGTFTGTIFNQQNFWNVE
jgi:hypothetical protein